jgi:hypothetical protein
MAKRKIGDVVADGLLDAEVAVLRAARQAVQAVNRNLRAATRKVTGRKATRKVTGRKKAAKKTARKAISRAKRAGWKVAGKRSVRRVARKATKKIARRTAGRGRRR